MFWCSQTNSNPPPAQNNESWLKRMIRNWKDAQAIYAILAVVMGFLIYVLKFMYVAWSEDYVGQAKAIAGILLIEHD